jgi:SpoVK/Ycf46/Vps4 family AAA+-type ATPase
MPDNDELNPIEDHANPRRRRRPEEPPEVGTIVEPEPRHDLRNLVLHADAKADIEAALRSVEMRDRMESVWRLSEIQPLANRCVINFYGPPGTGKTRAALGIARRVGRLLYQVDYSQIVSKYLGDTAKHIALAFRQAREAGAVLFFDEADSLLSRRVPAGESCSTSINQNRNTLMQELDRFDGVVVMTTNLFGNYDEAMLRRIARHVRFALPDRAMRERLLRGHLPNADRTPADLRRASVESRGLSGGDILNACVNAMHAASADPNPDRWRVTEAMLLAEISKIKVAKATHEGGSDDEAR